MKVLQALYATGTTAAASTGSGSMSIVTMVLWLGAMVALMYFLMIRPQKKEQKRLQAMLGDMAVGDSVVTTGGFYGVILDMTDEDVIVEFGSNKNCRIPMRKSAIAEVEKADAGAAGAGSVKESTKITAKDSNKDSKKDSSDTEEEEIKH